MEQKTVRTVAFLHSEFPFGGGERVTLDIMNYLRRFGYKFIVFCSAHHTEKYPDDFVPFYKVVTLLVGNVNHTENIRFIIDYINRYAVQVLIIAGLLYKHSSEIRLSSSCKLIYIHHVSPFWEVTAKEGIKRHRADKSVLHKLWWICVEAPRFYLLGSYQRRYENLYRRILSGVDRYVVLCEGYKKKIVETLQFPDVDRIQVINNSERLVSNPSLQKKKQVLYVGRMDYVHKRVDRLLDIWGMIYKEVPDWELILVGDGEDKTALEKKMWADGLERVRFEGFQADVSGYYREAAVLCLVSTFEGWPLCLTEAQANGVVPVAFDCVAGIHEILSPSGENGILVPPFDLDIYAKELLALLQDEERVARMRKNVLKKAEDYDIERVGMKYKQLIDELINT